MKTIVFTLLLYFSLFAAAVIYATESNVLVGNYPASSASYNKIILNTQPNSSGSNGTPVGCSSSTVGMLSMDTVTTGALQLCAKVNGTASILPLNTTCFNRFCSSASSGSACSLVPATCPVGDFSSGSNCPAGFAQTTNSGGTLLVQSTTVDCGITVYNILCCSTGSPAGIPPQS